MNISSHVLLPIRWKLGQYRLDGSLVIASNRSMSHWFPVNTFGRTIFFLNPNSVSLYGNVFGRPNPPSSASMLSNLSSLSGNFCVHDSDSPALPSKPFSYILIK